MFAHTYIARLQTIVDENSIWSFINETSSPRSRRFSSTAHGRFLCKLIKNKRGPKQSQVVSNIFSVIIIIITFIYRVSKRSFAEVGETGIFSTERKVRTHTPAYEQRPQRPAGEKKSQSPICAPSGNRRWDRSERPWKKLWAERRTTSSWTALSWHPSRSNWPKWRMPSPQSVRWPNFRTWRNASAPRLRPWNVTRPRV